MVTLSPDEKEGQKNLERLIKAIDKAYHNPGPLVWRGFLIGLASGVGGVIGIAIIIGLLGLLVAALGGVPVLGELLKSLFNTVNGNDSARIITDFIKFG